MTTNYVKFRENNEWEGEAWTFWLPTEGNEAALLELENALDAAHEADDEFPYELRRNVVRSEEQIDSFVEDAEDDEGGYYSAHNKVTGRLILPDELGEPGRTETFDYLYKGGIRDLFKKG